MYLIDRREKNPIIIFCINVITGRDQDFFERPMNQACAEFWSTQMSYILQGIDRP